MRMLRILLLHHPTKKSCSSVVINAWNLTLRLMKTSKPPFRRQWYASCGIQPFFLVGHSVTSDRKIQICFRNHWSANFSRKIWQLCYRGITKPQVKVKYFILRRKCYVAYTETSHNSWERFQSVIQSFHFLVRSFEYERKQLKTTGS